MRVVFFGTPDFAVPTLDALLASGADVAAVVTQPDRPRTRSHSTLLPTPVKSRAVDAGIPVLQPDRPRGAEFLANIAALNADLGVVVAYGHLLRPELLAIPRHGMINVHASLLPRWRGAAPIHWAVLSGDMVTGVSIMRMEAGLDSGPVWHAVRTAIDDQDTTGQLFTRLAAIGAGALVDTLPRIVAGAAPAPQDEAEVTLAPKIDRDLARIRWDASVREVSCRVRAMDPFPGAWTMLGTEPIKLFGPAGGGRAPHPTAPTPPAPIGTIVATHETLRVVCNDGLIDIGEVQPAGRRRMPASQWLRGAPLDTGSRFA
jgi:methionyl-tRNA formyltransferase